MKALFYLIYNPTVALFYAILFQINLDDIHNILGIYSLSSKKIVHFIR